MKYRIRAGWNLFRILRMLAGIAIAVQGEVSGDWLFAIAGGMFTVLAFLNTGCSSGGSCVYPSAVSKKKDTEQTTYEKVV